MRKVRRVLESNFITKFLSQILVLPSFSCLFLFLLFSVGIFHFNWVLFFFFILTCFAFLSYAFLSLLEPFIPLLFILSFFFAVILPSNFFWKWLLSQEIPLHQDSCQDKFHLLVFLNFSFTSLPWTSFFIWDKLLIYPYSLWEKKEKRNLASQALSMIWAY